MFEIGDIEQKFTAAGRHSGYQVRVYHSGLDEVRYLSAADISILQGKLDNLVNSWSQKWQRKEAAMHKAAKADEAQTLTEESQELLKPLEQILTHTLSVNDTVGWNSLKNIEPFPDPEPKKPKNKEVPSKPRLEHYQRDIPIFKMLTGQKEKILGNQQTAYQEALLHWEKEKKEVVAENDKLSERFNSSRADWLRRKNEFQSKQSEKSKRVDYLKERYLSKNEDAVTEYCEIVLNNSAYPEGFPSDFEIQFSSESGMLIVNYALPTMDDIPKRISVRYVASRDMFEDKFLSETKSKALYNSVCYQIAIRTLHELFEADTADALSTVTFNGFVTVTNLATGNTETNCIMSVQSSKEEFLKINLANVDPKACFKVLKGVGSANLATITPVKAILEMDKSDRRFRDHYEVTADIDHSTNLAAMDWEDFEHLVRELFEAEFRSAGGEVRVTQASRDGGVDAIAFDPDPIRGGKIVIQAKRYTNTVGVAAVRDLYGTVVNEGATKGILVTTSDYGADSYEFAKNKPLTLLNGSNLLHMLEKHGTRAKIDIKEAKKILSDQ